MAELTGVQKQYILHWGEMGTRWGINRTVAQIHALLYLSPRALPAEEIAETLKVRNGAAKHSIFRAVEKMRRALEPAMRPAR